MINFSDTSSSVQVATQGSVSAVLAAFFSDSITQMIPFLILAAIVILVDLKFGISAAAHRGEKVRTSRAIRRTIDKMISYFCWVLLAATASVAFSMPAIEYILMGAVIGIELLSISSNWLEIKGYKVEGLNVIKIVGDKIGVDVGEAHVEKIEKPEEEQR